ncbi:MAG: hypothetical protein WC292_01555 [Clostridia bacterium]
MGSLSLTIDLLPKGAWGNNLSKVLSKKDWDILRKACYERAQYRCIICGKEGDLDAHEVWNFDIKTKTQTLKDIIALCSACHGVKHVRNSERIGYGESAKRHFLKINKCSPIVFAGHYAEAQILFDERNEVKRWKVKAELEQFGGKGIEIKERHIPIIINPYDGVDWKTIIHKRKTIKELSSDSKLVFESIILQSADLNNDMAIYFTTYQLNAFPPKINFIEVDNYAGTITVVSERVNKIQWIANGKIIKTKYNFAKKLTDVFSAEDLDDLEIRFVLTNNFGETVSATFRLHYIA